MTKKGCKYFNVLQNVLPRNPRTPVNQSTMNIFRSAIEEIGYWGWVMVQKGFWGDDLQVSLFADDRGSADCEQWAQELKRAGHESDIELLSNVIDVTRMCNTVYFARSTLAYSHLTELDELSLNQFITIHCDTTLC